MHGIRTGSPGNYKAITKPAVSNPPWRHATGLWLCSSPLSSALAAAHPARVSLSPPWGGTGRHTASASRCPSRCEAAPRGCSKPPEGKNKLRGKLGLLRLSGRKGLQGMLPSPRPQAAFSRQEGAPEALRGETRTISALLKFPISHSGLGDSMADITGVC